MKLRHSLFGWLRLKGVKAGVTEDLAWANLYRSADKLLTREGGRAGLLVHEHTTEDGLVQLTITRNPADRGGLVSAYPVTEPQLAKLDGIQTTNASNGGRPPRPRR